MTKDEFVNRVVEIIESGKMEDLEKLYDELMKQKNCPEVVTSGGGLATVTWGTR